MFRRPYRNRLPNNSSWKSLLLFVFLILAPSSGSAQSETLSIVTTVPVLKDFVEQIGGTRVTAKSLISGPDVYKPNPVDLLSVKQARMFVKVGLGLETWVDDLLRDAGNRSLLTVTASEGVPLIKNTEEPENSELVRPKETFKERHSMGNPHIWLDPENAKTMVRHITDGLIRIDPQHRGEYLQHQSDYLKILNSLEDTIKRKVRALPDRRIITYHSDWPYFTRRFGFTVEGTLVDPARADSSDGNLQALIERIRKKRIRVLVSEPQLDPQRPNRLAQETGIKILILSPLPGVIPGTETYADLIRYDAD